MIHLILLAAGSGSRFGANKLLATLDGAPVWRHGYRVLQTVAAACGARLHVVSRYSEILDAAGADGVACPEGEKGVSYTIRAACRACGSVAPTDRLLFLAADQPRITAETVQKLLSVPLASSPDGDAPVAACTFDGENTGNPVVFAGFLLPDLTALSGDQGGKRVLRPYPTRVARVLCDAAELADVDTPDDLKTI